MERGTGAHEGIGGRFLLPRSHLLSIGRRHPPPSRARVRERGSLGCLLGSGKRLLSETPGRCQTIPELTQSPAVHRKRYLRGYEESGAPTAFRTGALGSGSAPGRGA